MHHKYKLNSKLQFICKLNLFKFKNYKNHEELKNK
jgi:hypothetical protein